MKASRLALIVAGAFSVAVMMAGPAQAVCDPHCSPKSNTAGEVRGLNRANVAAGEQHGQHGRDKAAAKQDLHKPGGSGVVSGGSGDTGTTDTGTGGTGGTGETGGTTDPPPGPCTGC